MLLIKVILADAFMQPVDETVRAAVQAHIEEVRPAGGITVTVLPAEAVTIDVSARVTLDTSVTAETVKAAFTAALTGYLSGLAMQDGTLLYNRLAYLLLGIGGVKDFAELTINGGTANIALLATQTPVLGTVEVAV